MPLPAATGPSATGASAFPAACPLAAAAGAAPPCRMATPPMQTDVSYHAHKLRCSSYATQVWATPNPNLYLPTACHAREFLLAGGAESPWRISVQCSHGILVQHPPKSAGSRTRDKESDNTRSTPDAKLNGPRDMRRHRNQAQPSPAHTTGCRSPLHLHPFASAGAAQHWATHLTWASSHQSIRSPGSEGNAAIHLPGPPCHLPLLPPQAPQRARAAAGARSEVASQGHAGRSPLHPPCFGAGRTSGSGCRSAASGPPGTRPGTEERAEERSKEGKKGSAGVRARGWMCCTFRSEAAGLRQRCG